MLSQAHDVEVHHDYDPDKKDLYVEAEVVTDKGVGRAVFSGGHQHLVAREKDHVPLTPEQLSTCQDPAGVLAPSLLH